MTTDKKTSRAGYKKKNYTAQFKLDRALEAVNDKESVPEIARKYDIKSNLIYLWRKQLIERGTKIFETAPDQNMKEMKAKVGRLEQMIGKKEVELSLIKNFSDFYSSRNQT